MWPLFTDSSPKTPAAKSSHSLSKEVLLNSPSACITPTRPTRNCRGLMIDESPTLSQEPMKVTWQWGGDSPVRPLCDTINPLRSIRQVLGTVTSTTTNGARNPFKGETSNATITTNEASNSSPKGLYKFQEELRRIHESATNSNGVSGAGDNCDGNDHVDDAHAMADDSYTEHETSSAMLLGNDSFSMSPIAMPSDAADENANDAPSTTKENANAQQNLSDSTLNAFKNDLLNDSDFDQVLLTCGEKIENESKIATGQAVVKNAVEEVKQHSAKTENTNTPAGNSFFLDNDESIDDFICNIDDAFIMNSMLKMKQSKFSRHNSMPPKADNVNTTNQRRSFTRHESMPTSSVQNQQSRKEPGSVVTLSQSSTESAMSSRCLPAISIHLIIPLHQ